LTVRHKENRAVFQNPVLQAERAHVDAMAEKYTRPMFKPLPNVGYRWHVEVQWPDGARQLVADFVSDYEACDWISNRSAAWLLKNPDGRSSLHSVSLENQKSAG
jgi:hypothetical protein